MVEVIRYALVGLGNTAVGLSIIFALMHLGVADVWSNAAGYAVGLCVSFVLNGKWTFRSTSLDVVKFVRFLAVVLLSYLSNLAAFLIARDAVGLGSHVSQLAGAVAYTAVGFVGTRLFVFAPRVLPSR